jgi:hypothetical protein
MILGLYESDPDDWRELRVLKTVFIDGRLPSARTIIEEYITRYDSLLSTCATHHGSDVYNVGVSQ